MPSFEIKGRGKDTGRKRNRIYTASNELEAKQLAENDGTQVEEIIELPPELPTDKQLNYAKDLGITIPTNATKDDLSEIISVKVNKDKPSTERHKSFARIYGIEFNDYIGKKALFNRIQTALIISGREQELLSWFTFRVYRELINGIDNAPIDNPNDPIIQEIATELASDEKIVKSVRRYEGKELIWFGEWTSSDGYVHTGGSNRTAAYKQVSSMLKQRVNFPAPARNQNRRNASESKGCLFVIVIALAISVGIIFSAAWLGEIFA
ncbi:MAG: hypothetical protein K9L22_12255 [Methylococcaceae bacterium]|nr:hypothetical protein [Methylococcaceae bacterium]